MKRLLPVLVGVAILFFPQQKGGVCLLVKAVMLRAILWIVILGLFRLLAIGLGMR